MTDIPPQSTLRELREHLARPVALALLGAAILILTLMGPFGTSERLSLVARLGYWALIVGATYAVGFVVNGVLEGRAGRGGDRRATLVQIASAALATGVGVTLTVLAINAVVLGLRPWGPGAAAAVSTIFAIAVLVTAAVDLAQRQVARGPAAEPHAGDRAPALLDRLPLDKRGALVALSVEDHYVRIRTTQGEEMVLMRLSDAIREAAPVRGLRVHRSHWVAVDQVRAVRREGDRAILTLAAGGDIPASRSHIPALKDAGLLPR